MNARSLISIILMSLSPLSSVADEVRISTTFLTVPNSMEIPGQVRTVTMSEWRKMVGSLSLIKGVPLFITPAATTSSGKMTRLDIGSRTSGGFWRRNQNPVSPVASIEYTPRVTRGGIELTGYFTMNRGSVRVKDITGIVTAGKVHGYIPYGKVLTFRIGEHLFGVMVSKAEGKNSNQSSPE